MKNLFWLCVLLFIGYILASLFGCSPEARMSRIIKKHPELAIKDTLTIQDTTIIEASSVDSTFIFKGDTIYIRDGKQEIKYFYNTITKENYIKGEIKADTIIKEIQVPYEKYVIEEKSWWDKYKDIIIVILLLTIAIFAFKK